jgi:hypothetical protein
VIDPTDEMLVAWRDAMKAAAADAVKAGEPLGRSQEVARAGLAAVLAVVERDYDVRPARQSLPPCGTEGPDGLRCERNPHTPDSAHGALVDEGLVRW